MPSRQVSPESPSEACDRPMAIVQSKWIREPALINGSLSLVEMAMLTACNLGGEKTGGPKWMAWVQKKSGDIHIKPR